MVGMLPTRGPAGNICPKCGQNTHSGEICQARGGVSVSSLTFSVDSWESRVRSDPENMMTTLLAHAVGVAAILLQTPSTVTVAWNAVLRQPDAWYETTEAQTVADRVLLYQRQSGGWPKDIDMTVAPPPGTSAPAAPADSTIDNGATTTQIRLLARVSTSGRGPRDRRYSDAIERGLDYLLAAQYAHGGWPQFFPLRTDYSRYITFNDNAMINVLTLLDDVAEGRAPFASIDSARRGRAREAVQKGVGVILRTQVRVKRRADRVVRAVRRANVRAARRPDVRAHVAERDGNSRDRAVPDEPAATDAGNRRGN